MEKKLVKKRNTKHFCELSNMPRKNQKRKPPKMDVRKEVLRCSSTQKRAEKSKNKMFTLHLIDVGSQNHLYDAFRQKDELWLQQTQKWAEKLFKNQKNIWEMNYKNCNPAGTQLVRIWDGMELSRRSLGGKTESTISNPKSHCDLN